MNLSNPVISGEKTSPVCPSQHPSHGKKFHNLMTCWTKKSLPSSIFSCCLVRWPLVPLLLQKFHIFIILDIFTILPFQSSLLQVEGHYLFRLLYRKLLWLFLLPLSIPFMLSCHRCWFDQSQWQLIDWQFHIWILPNLLCEYRLLLLICCGTDLL